MSSCLSSRRRFAAAVAFLCTAVLSAQTRVVDDAQRTVGLPAQVDRVFAAAAPAEVLLYTLTPDKLAGWNRVAPPGALDLYPPRYRNYRLIERLRSRQDPERDADLRALDDVRRGVLSRQPE